MGRQTIDTRTGRIAYLRRKGESGGGGVPLVLLHGIGSRAASFSTLMQVLDPTLDVIAWNAPGYDASEPLPIEWPQAADYADALEAFLDALCLDSVHLAGHSLGTLVAAAYAVARPERLKTLALMSCALGQGVAVGEPLPEAARVRLDALDQLGPAAFAAERAPRLMHAPERRPHVLAEMREAMASVTQPGYGQAVRMLASGRLLDDAARVTVPTLLLTGAQDVVTPPEATRRVYQAVAERADARFVAIDDAGHAVAQERPEAVADAMHEFLGLGRGLAHVAVG